jgi:hypothetical protein
VTLHPADQKLVDNVAAHGWHCMHIGAGRGEPHFSYSIGWWETLGAPEVIVFGLSSKLHHSMLWGLFRQIEAGRRLEDGARFSDLIEGFDCIARPVDGSHLRSYFGFALWYRRYRTGTSEGLEAFQLFWPGKVQGLYPWDEGCIDGVGALQPLLYWPRISGSA